MYSYTLTNTFGSTILGPQNTTDTMVQTTVIVLPYEMYTIEVVGITAGGGEGIVTMSTALSPEAGENIYLLISREILYRVHLKYYLNQYAVRRNCLYTCRKHSLANFLTDSE